jgi:hypothetical protein
MYWKACVLHAHAVSRLLLYPYPLLLLCSHNFTSTNHSSLSLRSVLFPLQALIIYRQPLPQSIHCVLNAMNEFTKPNSLCKSTDLFCIHMLEHVCCQNITDVELSYRSSPTLVVSVWVGFLFTACTSALNLCNPILQASLGFK